MTHPTNLAAPSPILLPCFPLFCPCPSCLVTHSRVSSGRLVPSAAPKELLPPRAGSRNQKYLCLCLSPLASSTDFFKYLSLSAHCTPRPASRPAACAPCPFIRPLLAALRLDQPTCTICTAQILMPQLLPSTLATVHPLASLSYLLRRTGGRPPSAIGLPRLVVLIRSLAPRPMPTLPACPVPPPAGCNTAGCALPLISCKLSHSCVPTPSCITGAG